MNLLHNEIKPEQKISPKVLILILLVINTLFIYWIEGSNQPWQTTDQGFTYFLIIFGVSGVAMTFEWIHTLAGRWAIYLALTGIIIFTALWWRMPEFLILAAMPIGLLAAMLNIQSAAAACVLLSALLLGFHRALLPGIPTPVVNLSVFASWIMLGTLFSVFLPYEHILKWTNSQLKQVNQFLAEARGRKAELEHTLESLANANRQLALANRKMAELSSIAEDAQKAKTAFVANVSHEFRTPLNMITGLIDLMMRTPENYDVILSPKMREDFHVIYRNCEHLSNMVNDVLDLTRVETGRLMLYREWVNLNEIIEKSITVVRPLMEKKRLVMKMEVPPDLPPIYCDRMRIQQVVLNLFSNAARFTERGEILLKVHSQNQSITVEVTDTGPGILLEDRERIFEPFWQGHDPIWQKKGGSGIGLSLSREFITLHGGNMWFTSAVGQGTSFFFSIPIAPVLDPISKPGHFIKGDWVWQENAFLSAQSSDTDQLVRPRVVLFDQTETLFPRFVRYSDQVEFANMPTIDQMTKEVSARAFILNAPSIEKLWPMLETALNSTTHTPIIGCSVPGEYRRALELGARGYLIKPIKIEDLQRVLAVVETPVREVLIADDDPDILDLYQRMLLSLNPNLEVRTVTCGEDALAQLRRGLPDLMFLDVIMPGMTGWQVMETISQEHSGRLFPIYFITAQDPVDQLASGFLLATIKGGVPLGKLLRGSLDLAELLMESEKEPDRVPGPAPAR